MQNLPKKLKIYIVFQTLLSILLLIHMFNTYNMINIKFIVFFAVLAIISESLAIQLSREGGASVGFAIYLAAIIIGGPLTGAIVSALGITFRIVKLSDRGYIHILNTSVYKTLFNASLDIIVNGISGIIYLSAGGSVGVNDFELLAMPTLYTILSCIILNALMMAVLMNMLGGQGFFKTWIKTIKDIFPSLFGIGILGIIIALAYISYGPFAVVLFFGPLLLARFSFKLYTDMRHVYMDTIHALTNTVEAKDTYTSGHATRVQKYAVELAKALELPEKKIENIKTAALLHDIGKIGVDDSILNKPGRLTDDEFVEIKRHPDIGAQILKDVHFLKDITEIIKYHHERYDGTGYPEGIKGEDIPIEAAIVSIADVYDAMTSDRPYRKALSKEIALKEIEDNAGRQFNPRLVEAFVGYV